MDDPQPPDIEDILAELHDDARGRIKEELLPGEQLLWAARSQQEPFRVGQAILTVLLLITFTVGSVTCFRFVFRSEQSGGGTPEGLVAIGILAGIAAGITGSVMAAMLKGVLNTRWTRSRHLYAITDRRVIMRTPTFDRMGIQVRALDLSAVGTIHRTEYPDGLGTLTFSVESVSRSVDPEHAMIDQLDSYQLEKIPDIRRVELLLRQVVSESKVVST